MQNASWLFIMVASGLALFLLFLSYLRKVSHSEKIVEELELAKKRIESEKVRDEALLESIGDGVVATDREGVIIFINKVAQEMLSWGQDIVGKKLGEVSLLADVDGKHVSVENHPLHRCIETRRKAATKDYHFVRKDKIDLSVYISATPVILNNEVVGAIEVFRDITKEQEVDRAKSEFVSLASHQLRTPLSTVSWYAEMLLDGDAGKLNIEQRKYIEQIYESNHRMIDLVNSLLNVSRIELGTFEIRPEKINLAETADSILAELRQQINQRGVRIIKKYEQDLPAVKADHNLARVVLQNLLSNAVKYTSEKGFVEIEMFSRGKDVLVRVADNGCGIPKNQQEKIFTKLFRADNVKELVTDGNGLGLYIVKSIIEQSGGKIWFESEEGRGTTFYVSFPFEIIPKKGRTKIMPA